MATTDMALGWALGWGRASPSVAVGFLEGCPQTSIPRGQLRATSGMDAVSLPLYIIGSTGHGAQPQSRWGKGNRPRLLMGRGVATARGLPDGNQRPSLWRRLWASPSRSAGQSGFASRNSLL